MKKNKKIAQNQFNILILTATAIKVLCYEYLKENKFLTQNSTEENFTILQDKNLSFFQKGLFGNAGKEGKNRAQRLYLLADAFEKNPSKDKLLELQRFIGDMYNEKSGSSKRLLGKIDELLGDDHRANFLNARVPGDNDNNLSRLNG